MAIHRVFVSSAPADADFCTELVAHLRAAGADVWYDPSGTGDTEHELATRTSFVVVLSAASLASAEIRFEVAGALRMLRIGTMRTLVPVVLPGCEVPPGIAEFPGVYYDSLDGNIDASNRSALLVALGLSVPGSLHATSSGVNSDRALVPQVAPTPPRPGAAEPIVLPPPLSTLGFSGWHIADFDLILPPLRTVRGDSFVMGSAASEAPHNERPAHNVAHPSFAIGTFPVTVAEYACFVGAGHSLPPDVGRITWSGQFSRLDHPVVNVSWHDANAYAVWLAVNTGGRWRLPTEAEWEYAARWDATKQHANVYPWGDEFDSERCNTRESSIGATTPVAIYANGASPCGAREMVGNVREWTSSRYAPYPYVATDGRERPDGTGERVQRGGSWFSFASEVRAATREWQTPDTVSPYVGFRLVLEATAAPA